MTSEEKLKDLLKQLAIARRDYKTADEIYKEIERAFFEENALLLEKLKTLGELKQKLYDLVCEAALEVARETGDLRPQDIEIRSVFEVQYDDEQVFIQWALERAPNVLRVEINRRALTAEKARELRDAGAPIRVEAVRKPFVPSALGYLLVEDG